MNPVLSRHGDDLGRGPRLLLVLQGRARQIEMLAPIRITHANGYLAPIAAATGVGSTG